MQVVKSGCGIAVALCVVIWSAVPSGAEDIGGNGTPKEPGNGILCLHMTMISLLAVARECFPERDREYIAAMEEAIARFDDFVMRNHPAATAENLAAFHEHHSEVGRKGALEVPDCQPMEHSIVGMYESFRQRTPPEKLRETTDALLAVDRVPTFDPCY